MPAVEIWLNERRYRIGCGEGEEDRLRSLADYVDRHMKDLLTQIGDIPDPQLIAITCLSMADRLLEEQEAHGRTKGEMDILRHRQQAELRTAIDTAVGKSEKEWRDRLASHEVEWREKLDLAEKEARQARDNAESLWSEKLTGTDEEWRGKFETSEQEWSAKFTAAEKDWSEKLARTEEEARMHFEKLTREREEERDRLRGRVEELEARLEEETASLKQQAGKAEKDREESHDRIVQDLVEDRDRKLQALSGERDGALEQLHGAENDRDYWAHKAAEMEAEIRSEREKVNAALKTRIESERYAFASVLETMADRLESVADFVDPA